MVTKHWDFLFIRLVLEPFENCLDSLTKNVVCFEMNNLFLKIKDVHEFSCEIEFFVQLSITWNFGDDILLWL